MLSGRYADVLSGLFLGYSTLWYTSHHKNVKGLDKVTDYAMQVRHSMLFSDGGWPFHVSDAIATTPTHHHS